MADHEEIVQAYRQAGKVSAQARDLGADMIEEGGTYIEVAEAVEGHIKDQGLGLAFPANISVNDTAAHFTPVTDSKLKFETGDLVKIDCGAHLNGYIGDTAKTVEVGTRNHNTLIKASENRGSKPRRIPAFH